METPGVSDWRVGGVASDLSTFSEKSSLPSFWKPDPKNDRPKSWSGALPAFITSSLRATMSWLWSNPADVFRIVRGLPWVPSELLGGMTEPGGTILATTWGALAFGS